jgi:hypothetical protein
MAFWQHIDSQRGSMPPEGKRQMELSAVDHRRESLLSCKNKKKKIIIVFVCLRSEASRNL